MFAYNGEDIMKSGYSLISFIGKSDKKNGTYRKTNYKLSDGKIIEATSASNALIEYYKDKLEKVVIIGTEISSWNELLHTQNDNLFLSIEEEIESSGITEETRLTLEEELSNSYQIPFELYVQPSELNDENTLHIIDLYANMYNRIDSDSTLIIDVTHGFRYMPMLLFQVLQLRESKSAPSKVIQVYGEYYDGVSHFRDISAVWNMAEINKQMYSFESAFDGLSLGHTLIKYGQKRLGEWIIRFSDNVQKNYVMLIRNDIRDLRRIFYNNSISTDYAFVKEIKSSLDHFNSNFPANTEDYLSLFLLAFAKVLFDRGLMTQAIIALREALYTRLFEKYEPELIAKYISLEERRKKPYHQAFEENCARNCIYDEAIKFECIDKPQNYAIDCRHDCLFKDVYLLSKTRNRIAHAGAELILDKTKGDDFDFRKIYKSIKQIFEEDLV